MVSATDGDRIDERAGAARILVVDDDRTVVDVVRRYLLQAGYDVLVAHEGRTALDLVARERVDLLVVDLMLPGVDGLEVTRRVQQTCGAPVVMLTALGQEADRVAGFETGADDYVTKPFSPRELVLRVRSVLRRVPPSRDGVEPLRDGDLVVDPGARTATRSGRPLALTSREFDLLCFLLRTPGVALSREQLLAEVWGWTFGDASTVTVHVRRLREKVEPDPRTPTRIVTVWGTGYRFEPSRPVGSTVGAGR